MSIAAVITNLTTARENRFSANVSKRVVNAYKDTVPLEELVLNLRKAFISQHEQVTEARFEEMIDIVSDQKSEVDDRFNSVAVSLNNIKDQQLDLEGAIDARLAKLHQELSEEIKTVLKSQQESESRTTAAFNNLEKSFEDFSSKSKDSWKSLTDVVSTHIEQDKKDWDASKDYTLSIIEQRIAQWRAEIEDTRREDMNYVANSMVDIGHRLMAMHKA